jgi:transmembrane sensor
LSNNSNHITDDLLVMYLLGEANLIEEKQVEEWINATPENRKYYEQFKLIWEESRKQSATQFVNEHEAWQRFHQRIHNQSKKTAKNIRMAAWLRVAALVIVLAGGTWLTYRIYYSQPEQVTVQASDKILTNPLPDGSTVTLNEKATLSYPEKFKGKTRTVALTGEAFFEVTPDKQKPFVVKAGDVAIKVVGTSFNVHMSDDSTEIIVETGIVEVSRGNSSVQLKAGEKTVIRKQDTSLIKEQEQDKLYNYYKTNEFVCDNTPLWKLVAALNEAYNANIVIERPPIRTMPITTTFKNESLDRILEIVRLTLNITVEKTGDKIILR